MREDPLVYVEYVKDIEDESDEQPDDGVEDQTKKHCSGLFTLNCPTVSK